MSDIDHVQAATAHLRDPVYNAAVAECDRLDRVMYERDRFLDRAVKIAAGVAASGDYSRASQAAAGYALELTTVLYLRCGLTVPDLAENVAEARARAVATLAPGDQP